MMKLTALYTVPADVEAFEAHYLSRHAPMVDAIPGLLRQETCLGMGSPDGSPAAYYRQADLCRQRLKVRPMRRSKTRPPVPGF